MSSKGITEESWIDESIQESISMSASLPRSRGSNEKRSSKGRNEASASKIIASKISSDYIPEEEHESSIIDEAFPGA
jgi:hypothetical protein